MKQACKIYYNLTVTAVSVPAALPAGGVEAIRVLSAEPSFKGKFRTYPQNLGFASPGCVPAGG